MYDISTPTVAGSGYTTGAGKATSGFVRVGLVAVDDYLYLGHSSPFFAFNSNVGAGTTQNVITTMVVQYWNGSAWTSVNNLVDGTKGSGDSLFLLLEQFIGIIQQVGLKLLIINITIGCEYLSHYRF